MMARWIRGWCVCTGGGNGGGAASLFFLLIIVKGLVFYGADLLRDWECSDFGGLWELELWLAHFSFGTRKCILFLCVLKALPRPRAR